MQRFATFFGTYRLFSVAISGLLASLALQLIDQSTAAHWLLSIIAITAVFPLLFSMWQDLKNGTYGIDILAATAIVASVLLGEYWAAIVVVIMLTGGKGLEDYAERRAKGELDSLVKNAPRTAHVLRKKKLVDVPVNELCIGDVIIIKPGEIVPADALISAGSGDFNESSLTGESLPQLRTIGDSILSGSISVDAEITAKVTADASDSQYQQIIKLVRSSAASQAPFVRLADRYSIPFTFLAFAIAITVWLFTGDAKRFLEVIIVATPCPLLLAAPIALMSGMTRASKYGVIVKTGSALEKLAAVKTIAFDKTGTLTSGKPTVDTITSYGSYTQDDILALAASLEQSSNHVLAAAIVEAATTKDLKVSKAKHVKESAGHGLSAQLQGKTVLVGRASLLHTHNVALPKTFVAASIDQTAVLVAVDGELAGVITLSDELRAESKDTLDTLHGLGIKHFMLVTGDNMAVATKIANELDIDDVHAEALPADKLHAVSGAKYKPLAFVGDGVNDAPVLTASSVGIALGARGASAASESADVVILEDNIARVATAVHIAKRTFSIARQSILIGIGLSVILMTAFATGKFSPLLGAVLQEVVDVVVIINALRAHRLKA